MHKLITISRPYARAILDFAIENKNIEFWKSILSVAAKVVASKKVDLFSLRFFSVKRANKKFLESYKDLGGEEYVFFRNLVQLMVEKNRLEIFPELLKQFLYLLEKEEKILRIKVISSQRIQKSQREKIFLKFKKKFVFKKINIDFDVDKSILSGIIIKIKDTVIKQTIKENIKQLKELVVS